MSGKMSGWTRESANARYRLEGGRAEGGAWRNAEMAGVRAWRRRRGRFRLREVRLASATTVHDVLLPSIKFQGILCTATTPCLHAYLMYWYIPG